MESIPSINDVFQAAQSGDASRLNDILEAYSSYANTENSDGLTPLGFAAHFGNRGAVQILIDHGADIDAVSHSKISFIPSNTALHAAIAGERNVEVIQTLLTHNAGTNILDSDGQTSLQTAAFHTDNVEIIRLLIQHGANANAKDAGGNTAMSIAVEQGNQSVAEFLRQHVEQL